MNRQQQKHDLTHFTVFFGPATCRLLVQFDVDQNDQLDMWLGIFDASKPDPTDYIIRSRDRDHMRQAVSHAFGKSREHLLDRFMDKAVTIQAK